MIRGDLVTVTLPGDYGKPRPAVIIQADSFDEHPTVVVLPLTTMLREVPLVRMAIEPDAHNGLHERSQIMLDKPHPVKRSRIGETIGRLDDGMMLQVNRGLAVFLGFA